MTRPDGSPARAATVAANGRERTLASLHAEIRACTKCVAAGYLREAWPIVAGKATDRVMIVGQAPGDVEVREGRPFAGRSGDTLGRWLGEAGLALEDVYRSAVTKCFPGEAAHGVQCRRANIRNLNVTALAAAGVG